MNQELKTSARSEYLNHISAQKTSGLGIVKYCELHNVDPNKFYYYKSYRPATAKPKPSAANNFTQVKIQRSEGNLKLSPSKAESLPVEKIDKMIDPVWLAKFLFTLSSCK